MTPLELVDRFRERNLKYGGKKMSYPGRLDPMAEGVLLVLVGDENKKMDNYMKLDKEYVAEILIGLSTDSLDLLGVVDDLKIANKEKKDSIRVNEYNKLKPGSRHNDKKYLDISDDVSKCASMAEWLMQSVETRCPPGHEGSISSVGVIKELKKKIKSFKGKYKQKIPVYSSYIVKGKPLWSYARDGKLDGVEIPISNVEIKGMNVEDIYKIGAGKLLREIKRRVGRVKGDFRQKEIVDKWKELLDGNGEKFFVVKVRVNCSSGTYIRAIARDFGLDYGGGILFNLKRTRVGKFKVKDSERV